MPKTGMAYIMFDPIIMYYFLLTLVKTAAKVQFNHLYLTKKH